MKLLIKGGRVIDPLNGLDGIMDVKIKDGKIEKVARSLSDDVDEVLNASGKITAPGFIDMHVHLREPGREDEETILTGTKAAVRGGFTSVACMPNTDPPIDNQSVTEFILSKTEEEGFCNVFPIGCVSKGRKGEELAEIGELIKSGAVAISDDGSPVINTLILRRALEYSKMFDIPVIEHCEDPYLFEGGVMNEGYTSTLLGFKGIHAVGEEMDVGRCILLSRLTGGHIHIAHLSTKGSLEMVRDARKKGIPVTCEVTPHHITLTEDSVRTFDTNTKVNPPLRTEEDVAALLEGIADGTVDAVASDHAPHHKDEKDLEYDAAPFGLLGLETAVSLSLDALVHKRDIGWKRFVELFSTNPARILSIDKGSLSPGATADVTILDPEAEIVVDPNRFASKSRNTPFKGFKLKGAPWATIVSGKIVFKADS